ncbi:c-type cytochrome [Legionella sp. PATHC038]|uniref:c-type cytochrome n=1 Tax=Legionella sheltonii TaxID=2992041 RepID=UPI002243D535|nr:c-type cytochrome [Legionella sp. PATHC038]MCW8400468.1 c-type cytochrome [Legionella sp. PATHC038]
MQSRFWIKLVLITGILFINEPSIAYAGKLFSKMGMHQKTGVQLWADNCARCHNNRAPTEFTPNQWNTIMLHMRIQGGLTGEEAKEVLAYLTDASLSEFKTGTTTTASQQNNQESQAAKTNITKTGKPTASGKDIYQKNCVACHGVDGKGTSPAFPDFTKKGGVLSKSSSVLLQNTIKGIGGMPPKGGNPSLSDDDLKAALDYIESTFAK